MTDAGSAARERPLQIVFSLMHAGYLRHYGEPLSLLVERGHRVHLALGQPDKDPSDTTFVERLAALGPQVTVAYGPQRGYVDGWRRIAWLVRGLTDLARYADPRYADAWALRARMHEKVVGRMRASSIEPLSKRIVGRFAARVGSAQGAEEAQRYRGLLARLEEAVPPSRRHVRLLSRVRPDAVLASPVVEVASPQVEFVKAARALGIPSGVAVASWDNLTNKGLIRVVPDRVLVWNESQLREATEMHGVAPEQVVITGAQRFDEWFGREPSTTPEAFAAKVGLPAGRPFVLYLGSSPFIAPDEVSFVRRWVDALRASGRSALADAGVLVRPHPLNSAQWERFDAPHGVAVWPAGGAQPDSGEARDDFFDSLAHAAAVVGVNTSALIESGIVGKSVFTLLDPQFAGAQEGTLHFHYLLEENGGFLHVARSVDEHLEQLDAGVQGASDDSARNRRFAAHFVRPHGLDRPAAPIVADAIVALAALGPRERDRPRFGTRLLRFALLPFVAGNAAVAALVLAAQRLRGRRPHTLDEDP